jgi:hypothetical protein
MNATWAGRPDTSGLMAPIRAALSDEALLPVVLPLFKLHPA